MRERPFTASFDPDRSVLVLSGIIDELSLGEFRDALAAATQDPARHVTVDLSDVDFLPSIALSALITTRRTLQHDGGSLALHAQPGSMAHRVLQVAALLSE